MKKKVNDMKNMKKVKDIKKLINNKEWYIWENYK